MPTRDYFTPRAAVGPGARRLPRLNTELIVCELGEVVNLSMLGLRVRNTQVKIGDEHSIVVRGFELAAGPIQSNVVWAEHGEAGLRFTKAAKPVRKALSDLAMLAREQRSFPSGSRKMRDRT